MWPPRCAVIICVWWNSVSIAYLLATQQDVDQRDPRGRTLLHLAVSLGYIESAKVLLQHKADVTKENAQGWTGKDNLKNRNCVNAFQCRCCVLAASTLCVLLRKQPKTSLCLDFLQFYMKLSAQEIRRWYRWFCSTETISRPLGRLEEFLNYSKRLMR